MISLSSLGTRVFVTLLHRHAAAYEQFTSKSTAPITRPLLHECSFNRYQCYFLDCCCNKENIREEADACYTCVSHRVFSLSFPSSLTLSCQRESEGDSEERKQDLKQRQSAFPSPHTLLPLSPSRSPALALLSLPLSPCLPVTVAAAT